MIETISDLAKDATAVLFPVFVLLALVAGWRRQRADETRWLIYAILMAVVTM